MADKIILKRSSILGKRPTNQVIQAGELALNTNAEDPGAFFQVSDGNVVKVGPTAVSAIPPVDLPEKGESWFDIGNGVLKIGTVEEAKRVWKSIAAPFLGGGGNSVFVAPEFEYSTDNLRNDGQALPFRTLTRAILELSKIYISNVLGGYAKSGESNRYTVFLAPSLTTVFNDPGTTVEDFTTDFSTNPDKEVTFNDLVQFNSVYGGLILPSGITLSGMDLKKSVLSPTYVPSYRNPFFEEGYQGVNEPITSILRCSGNSYISNFSVIDKISFSEIESISARETYALFKSRRPHGLKFNDQVSVSFNPSVNQSTGTFTSGTYYAIPLNSFQFYLSAGSQIEENSEPYVLFTSIPILSSVIGPKLTVSLQLKSAHRLRLAANVSLTELGDYYTKVQKAFSSYFGGKITDGQDIVYSGEYVVVGPTSAPYPGNIAANTVKNSSFYANQVNLRSEYGMCWGDFDGSVVDGFKSVVANSCTAVTLQNDPHVYEVYTTLSTTEQEWRSLTEVLYLSLPVEERPALLSELPVEDQLNLLNTTPINNIRYYYQNLYEDSGEGPRSIGIVDIDNDFRHFGFRVRNGAYSQLQSIYTIGAAIGVWALNGGTCNLTNSTTNFGSVSFKAEGFLGINSIGGANPNGKGFVFEGIQRPLALTRSQAESFGNKKIFSLGSKIKSVYIDPLDPETQIIELSADFSPAFLLPYSLKPGSALWVETEDCTYRGFFATDGGPTVVTGLDDPVKFAKLRIRATDSTIPNDNQLIPALGVPYIRRFQDPRKDFERSYSFYLTSTLPTAVAPQVGDVLRLNQTSQQLGSTSIRPNVQFDPGVLGGWGRVFTVDAVETGQLGASPQFNYVLSDTNQDLNYFVALTVSDFSRPWTQGPTDIGYPYRFSNPYGTYATYKNRNWYTAENNLWEDVYYGEASSFRDDFGPYSVAPFLQFSPFVDSSVLERQDPVAETFQGSYAPDPYADVYSTGTYLRGATSPYPSFPTQDYYDNDDSSESLGICLSDVPDGVTTYLVTDSVVLQEEQLAVLKTPTQNPSRYRPAVISFSVLSPVGISNPKQKVSVVRLQCTDPATSDVYTGYVRVTNLNGAIVTGILLTFQNSFYLSNLSPEDGTNYIWQKSITQVTVCSTNAVPEPETYDPYWTNTKRAVFRFFEVMGYPNSTMDQYLQPKYWGERLLSVTSLINVPPEQGYALTTDKWPLEFNDPSAIIANTHTWAYTGYYNYSRGLLKYQSTDITRKLASDFQAYTLWSGRLTVTGINDKGEIVLFGPQRQALTANYYDPILPIVNTGNQQIYEEQPYVEFPSQVIVYSVDDISSQFNGSMKQFDLNRGGFAIPPNQLKTDSVLVILGAVVQKPGESYIISGKNITFSSAPDAGTNCDIRVITTADNEETLVAVPLTLTEQPNGSQTVFNAYYEKDGLRVDLTDYDINLQNTFVILGGVEQIPDSPYNSAYDEWAYSLAKDPFDATNIIITFNGTPPAGSTVDVRSICTNPYWATRGIYPVAVYSLDSLSGEFDGAKTVFDLTFEGNPVNSSTVTQENLIFSLGGAIQLPGVSYEIQGSKLIILETTDAPLATTTCNIRVITNAEFITCPDQGKYGANFVEWGPKLVLALDRNEKELEQRVQKLEDQG